MAIPKIPIFESRFFSGRIQISKSSTNKKEGKRTSVMKNKYVKRLLSVMAATAMVVSMLSGCGSSGESGDKGESKKRSFSV